MSARALEDALRAAGVHAAVDAEGAVAVMRIASADVALDDPEVRHALVAIAARHGFRNLALEVGD